MAAKLPDRLVVVVADHAVLRMESGEFRAVVQQRPVRDQHTEGLSEEMRFQEHRPRVHAGFLIHGKKLLPFLIVEAHHHAVRLAALFRMPPHLRDASSTFFFLFIFIMDLVVRFTAQAQLPARIPQVGNRLPDFGGEALPRKGQGRFRE